MESVLISLLILIIVMGIIYAVVQYLPLPAPFKNIALIVTGGIFLIILLLKLVPLL